MAAPEMTTNISEMIFWINGLAKMTKRAIGIRFAIVFIKAAKGKCNLSFTYHLKAAQ